MSKIIRERDSRVEYFICFILVILIEQFCYHDWDLYTREEVRSIDEALFEHSNMPFTAHNLKLFTMYRTEINMTDFVNFV